jgi:hypothetical protein
MPLLSREVRPLSKPRQVVSLEGNVLVVPDDWSLLPPGDAALSRRIKLDGPAWTMIELKGRKRFSRGIWAPTVRIEALRKELALERQNPAYEKKREAGRARRDREQKVYAGDFRQAILTYLGFHVRYQSEASILAGLITDHAVPVGSGTVARTERIPIEARAEAATLAWMRHRTTGYDDMAIARVKGERREVRRLLAQRSRRLLQKYRDGATFDQAICPLAQALPRPASVDPGPVQATFF